MKHYLSRLSARIRAICILLALFLVPDIVQAEDVYLLTAENINGTTGNYNVPSNHQFTNSPGTTEYTYTITSMPATGFWFRIGVDGWDKNMQPYTKDYPLPINGASYTISEKCYGKDKAWKVSYTEGEYKSLTITVNLDAANRYVKITGVKSSTGGEALPPVTRALTTAILSRRPLAMVFPTISVALSYATIRPQNLRKVISTTGKIISA